MALRAERGKVVIEERAELEQGGDKKRPAESEARLSSFGRPPRYPRSHSLGCGSSGK